MTSDLLLCKPTNTSGNSLTKQTKKAASRGENLRFRFLILANFIKLIIRVDFWKIYMIKLKKYNVGFCLFGKNIY